MIVHPFRLFDPFRHVLDIVYSTKADPITMADYTAHPWLQGSIASVRHMHGSRTCVTRTVPLEPPDADGLVTDTVNLVMQTRAADCQSFVIFVPQKRVLGVLHAGWRGVRAYALTEHCACLHREWGICPEDIWIGIGPSLRLCCAEFSDPQNEFPGVDRRFLDAHNHIDLAGIADDELDQIGVPRNQRERLSDCTCCCPDRYWTYRGGDRDAVQKGKYNAFTVRIRS